VPNLNKGFLSPTKNTVVKTAVQKGHEIEQLAADYLQKNGLQLLYRNFRCRLGEIDLIGLHQQSLVFVEVRFRRNNDYGGALASITYHKQRKLIRTSQFFLMTRHGFVNHACRFDVIAVTLKASEPEFEWIQNAFY
jgi:putative endonuclease